MDAQIAAQHAEIFWVAVAAVAGILGQVLYVAYRFGRIDTRIDDLTEDVRSLRRILNGRIKL